MLSDRFARTITYLRISVTDRCNFRCVYCMPAAGIDLVPHAEILSFEEIVRVVEAGAALGLSKLRLTGGEPTVRRDLPRLVALLREVDGIREIAMTTNGARLTELAGPLREAGLSRLNISLDTLNPERARDISRRDFQEQVLAGIETAAKVGFPLKFNTVVMRGVNDHEVAELVRFAHGYGAQIRFIEYMPMGLTAFSDANRMVPSAELRDRLSLIYDLEPDAARDPHDPARAYICRTTGARIGFIGSMTENFCAGCNRMRLTAQGGLRPCLHQDAEVDVRSVLRSGGDQAAVQDAFREAAGLKWSGHHMTDVIPLYTAREMVSIGG